MKKKAFSITLYIVASLILTLYIIIDLNKTMNLSEMGRVVLLGGCSIFLYFGGFLLSNYRKDNKPMKVNLWIFLALYLILIVTLTIFDKSWGRTGIKVINSNIDYKMYFENSVNLVPFKTIVSYIKQLGGAYSKSNVLFNLFGNLLAFTPLSVLLPLIFKKQNKLLVFILTMSGIIISIEFIQLLTSTGRFDIDDFILNLLGALVIYLITMINIIKKTIRNIFLLEK